jgi:hypothetical protein
MLVMPCRKFVSGILTIGAFAQRKLARLPIPKPMVERALIEVYQTVVLDQQRYRNHS